jgi:hypothetical protein
MFDTKGRPLVWLGIVNLAWLTLMGATCALLLVAYGEVIAGPLPPQNRSADFYHAAIEDMTFFLGFVMNGIFAGGAALGGCMAILWAGEIWRQWGKRGALEQRQYAAQTLTSAKMVFAYFVIVVASVGWAAVPIHSRLVALREMMPLPK